MKVLLNRVVDYITIEYKASSNGFYFIDGDEEMNEEVYSDFMYISNRTLRLERKQGFFDNEFFWEKNFSNGEFKSQFNKLCDMLLNLDDDMYSGLDGSSVEINIYFVGGDIRINRDVWGSFYHQKFDELVEILLEIIPSDWVIPKFCQ